MPRRLALFLFPLLCGFPVLAEQPNLASEGSGAATQLVLAQRTYRQAMANGDPVLLLAAIRLARGVTTRPAPGWERLGESAAPPTPAPERSSPPDPGSAAALAVLQGLAIDDPNLQDQAYDLDAQMPPGRLPVAVVAHSGVAGGAQDNWRVPLSGSVSAEIALIGDGRGPIGLTVSDEAGAIICARPATIDPALCRFFPTRNGFFTVKVLNAGPEWNTYQLVGN